MIQQAYDRYKAIQTLLETDEEYQELERMLREHSVRFEAVMQTLPKQQREIITEHLGICAEMAERITEIACFVP